MIKEIEDVAEIAGYLWERGWAEKNGGNITINITDKIDDKTKSLPAICEKIAIGVKLPYLKGCFFYAKGTMKRMRDLARFPMKNGAIIRICDDCEHYEIIAEEPVKPTSELPSHLTIHNYLLSIGSPYRATIHTHPIELTALTHSKKWMEKNYATKVLWSMMPDARPLCPKGLGIVPYMCPGSQKLADATIEVLAQDYDVVMWEKHGVVAVDTDIISAFDQIDTLNKSAQVYITARQMGFEPEGMTDAQLEELAVAFHLPPRK